jgi:hypothetical protein
MDAGRPGDPSNATRRAAEVVLPGFVIGLGAGMLIGLLGLAGGMSAGQSLAVTLMLGVPLALCGALYDVLLVAGRMGIGTIAPAAAFWLPLFPLARLLNEVLTDAVAGDPLTIRDGVAGFLLYQALLSVGFAIGWVFLHDQAAPLWWLRVRAHNPVAAGLIERYAERAESVERSKGGRARPRPGRSRPQKEKTPQKKKT